MNYSSIGWKTSISAQGAIVITHIMEIHMPFVINGTQTKVNIGLAENVPITLLSIPLASICTDQH
jgi:hypothetical protein